VAHVRAPGWERQFEATDDDLVKLAVLTVFRAPGWERQFEATDDDLVKLAVLTVYAKSNAAIRHADR